MKTFGYTQYSHNRSEPLFYKLASNIPDLLANAWRVGYSTRIIRHIDLSDNERPNNHHNAI